MRVLVAEYPHLKARFKSRGERLNSALTARGISKQLALAVQLGVDESAISRWRKGTGLSLEHAAQLCETLDISLDWLILARGDIDLHNRPEHSSLHHISDELSLLPIAIVEAFETLTTAVKIEIESHAHSLPEE
jgi:transcriptional regulator with XRE-family HTH domain